MTKRKKTQQLKPVIVKKYNTKPLLIVSGLVVAFVAALFGTYLIVQAQPSPETSLNKYYVYGGFALEVDDVDEHIITLLAEQTAIAKDLQLNNDVKGIYAYNHVVSPTLTESQVNQSTPVKVDISWDTYLAADTTNLKTVQESIGNYLTENGYEVLEGDTIYDDALTLQREVKVTNNTTGEETNKTEIVTLYYPQDYVEEGYYVVHIEMFSNISYPLGVVPTWSGILRSDENDNQWGWLQDDDLDLQLLCDLQPNTVIGFWDENYDCLQKIVKPGVYFEDDHNHSEEETH